MGCAAGELEYNLYLEEPVGKAMLADRSISTFNIINWLVGRYSLVRDQFPRKISHPESSSISAATGKRFRPTQHRRQFKRRASPTISRFLSSVQMQSDTLQHPCPPCAWSCALRRLGIHAKIISACLELVWSRWSPIACRLMSSLKSLSCAALLLSYASLRPDPPPRPSLTDPAY